MELVLDEKDVGFDGFEEELNQQNDRFRASHPRQFARPVATHMPLDNHVPGFVNETKFVKTFSLIIKVSYGATYMQIVPAHLTQANKKI